jgi:hypothetical protein
MDGADHRQAGVEVDDQGFGICLDHQMAAAVHALRLHLVNNLDAHNNGSACFNQQLGTSRFLAIISFYKCIEPEWH